MSSNINYGSIIDTINAIPPDEKNLLFYLLERHLELTNWRIFAQIVSDYYALEEPDINVRCSSSWAVCQEFLGNLEGDDLKYANSRAGTWAFGSNGSYHVSMRELITLFRDLYP